MLDLGNKNCCGCEACRNICPRHCILLEEDEEGFLYPKVDIVNCIDCDLCNKVCPVLHSVKNIEEPLIYAAINNNEAVRIQSSSGGIFTLLAESIIDRGGVVFGVCFDENWNVVHDYTETKVGLGKFRGSKYVQSYIGNSFSQVKGFLDAGREVLFSGTPCQVVGLKRYLRKSYSNLFTVDLVCHGVSSPKVWRKYLSESVYRRFGLKKKDDLSIGNYISSISFRAKDEGWKRYHLKIEYKDGIIESLPFYKNPYMSVFLHDLSLRPSCYTCSAKLHSVQSDITLADFWGVEKICPELDDDKGCGLVMLNNKEKAGLLYSLDCKLIHQSFTCVLKYNPSILSSVKEPVNRKMFFYLIEKFDFIRLHDFLCNKAYIFRLIRLIFRKIL